ncbi:hypothetical protein DOTSEDRAFT_29683 [Dothistroma septosporum NZE10]|uniref:Uncharacterized protein n=1 Tax=Dothistroma septosporum (strain NZE10 / CBS 128990) TaxID=675120 RepID=M2YHT3_DOTSN|nr:hypothetical protein DOTSEDRAFT_29683 [Dothistroma septosporum NZE10]
MLLGDDQVGFSPLAGLRQQYGLRIQIIYHDNSATPELQAVLETFELPVPAASRRSRRDDCWDALLVAKEDGALPEYVVLFLRINPASARRDLDSPPRDAVERHIESGVNYEDGRIGRSARRKKVGGYFPSSTGC